MLWLIAIPLLLLFALLVLPLEVEVDTRRDIFSVKWKGIFGIRGVPAANRWRWFFSIFFFEKEWTEKTKQPKSVEKKKVKKAKSALSPGQMWRLLKNMLRAVDVKRLRINWDTGDFALNAQLFPLCHFLSRRGRQFQINFFGKQEFSILLQTRPYRLAWAFLQLFFHPKMYKS